MAGAVVLCLLAAGATGCGGREIESAKAEAFVRGAVQPTPRAVDCPEGVEVEKGKTFECDVTTTDGAGATITVHMTDDEGKVRVGAGDLKRP